MARRDQRTSNSNGGYRGGANANSRSPRANEADGRYGKHSKSNENGYRDPRQQDQIRKNDNTAIRTIIGIIVSILYWPIAIIGVASPFLEGFNFGTLAPWQVIFSRFWLAFVMGGIIYAFAVNLFHIRNKAFFQSGKAIKIIIILVLTVAISFGVIRAICML